jgi:hypothetical protein
MSLNDPVSFGWKIILEMETYREIKQAKERGQSTPIAAQPTISRRARPVYTTWDSSIEQ